MLLRLLTPTFMLGMLAMSLFGIIRKPFIIPCHTRTMERQSENFTGPKLVSLFPRTKQPTSFEKLSYNSDLDLLRAEVLKQTKKHPKPGTLADIIICEHTSCRFVDYQMPLARAAIVVVTILFDSSQVKNENCVSRTSQSTTQIVDSEFLRGQSS